MPVQRSEEEDMKTVGNIKDIKMVAVDVDGTFENGGKYKRY